MLLTLYSKMQSLCWRTWTFAMIRGQQPQRSARITHLYEFPSSNRTWYRTLMAWIYFLGNSEKLAVALNTQSRIGILIASIGVMQLQAVTLTIALIDVKNHLFYEAKFAKTYNSLYERESSASSMCRIWKKYNHNMARCFQNPMNSRSKMKSV